VHVEAPSAHPTIKPNGNHLSEHYDNMLKRLELLSRRLHPHTNPIISTSNNRFIKRIIGASFFIFSTLNPTINRDFSLSPTAIPAISHRTMSGKPFEQTKRGRNTKNAVLCFLIKKLYDAIAHFAMILFFSPFFVSVIRTRDGVCVWVLAHGCYQPK
jgi:hypothetical protein